jgi:hypothetical protein
MTSDFERRKLGYAQSVQYLHALAEVRFKLLAFVPVAAGTAIGLLGQSTSVQPELLVAIGMFGFRVTFGLVSGLYQGQSLVSQRTYETGLHLAYGHLDCAALAVSIGDRVSRGQELGSLGFTDIPGRGFFVPFQMLETPLGCNDPYRDTSDPTSTSW